MNLNQTFFKNRQTKSKTLWVCGFYLLILVLCAGSLYSGNDLNFGRRPWTNLVRTVGDFTHPSFLNIWMGEKNFEYKNDEGVVLRSENQQELEKSFIKAVGRAMWMTFKVATFGSALAALFGFLLSWPASKKLNFPKPLFISLMAYLISCAQFTHWYLD